MREQIEGSLAVAKAVALCRPHVICAYPITPQTHIVENLSEMVKSGGLSACEFVNVESEFAALSVAIGASAAGARAYTATSSQGLLFMAEAVYNAAGLGLPIVMTIGNRAIGAPINIWNDHSDSMAVRDAGWIQLFAETNQEALDLHIQAFRLAETLSCPVMVCMDGFILTHAYESVDIPSQQAVDDYVGRFEPRQVLDPADPVTMGAMVGPEAFTEVRYLQHHKQLRALSLIPELASRFREQFGRASGGLLRSYRTEDAETIVVALGSVNGTVQEAVDAMRVQGFRVGSVSISSFRPFPLSALRTALQHAARVVVLEKCLAQLNEAKPVRVLDLSKEEWASLKPFCLITAKPVLYAANVAEDGFEDNPHLDAVRTHAAQEGAEVVALCAAIEAEIADLDDADKKDFLESMGLAEPGLDRLIRAGYKLLGLQTYFTAGVKEVRAWTIHVGDTAPQAAGVIHTDFERGFIRAQTIAYEDFIAYKGEAAAKEAGRMRAEGKDYVVKDGDVMNFLFNV